MIFQNSRIYTANGSTTNSIQDKLKMGIGVIYKIEVYFPPGCCGLTNVRLLYNKRQIYPLPNNQYFRGERNTISFDDTFIIDQPPYTIIVDGYNVDTLYDHLTVVRLGFESEPSYITRYIPPSITELIEQLQEKERKSSMLIRESVLSNLELLVKGDKK